MRFFIICLMYSFQCAFAFNFKIVSYNVQNLIESRKKDLVDAKINQISSVLKMMGMPDLIILQEVQNTSLLKQLSNTIGYSQFIITNSFDRRNMNIGVIYKLTNIKKISTKEIKTNSKFQTRSFLKVKIELSNSEKLCVIAIHLPSKGASLNIREGVFSQLKQEIIKEKKNFTNLIVVGDFNRDSFELENMLEGLFDNVCLSDNDPIGTYFYSKNGTWSRFDRFYISNKLKGKISGGCYKIFANKDLTENGHVFSGFHAGTTMTGVPKNFKYKKKKIEVVGYSDHFPIVLNLAFN